VHFIACLRFFAHRRGQKYSIQTAFLGRSVQEILNYTHKKTFNLNCLPLLAEKKNSFFRLEKEIPAQGREDNNNLKTG